MALVYYWGDTKAQYKESESRSLELSKGTDYAIMQSYTT